VAILREGLDFAKVEVRVRRAIDKYNAAESKDTEYELLLAVAQVEQWQFAHRDSKAIGVVEGAPYWWRGKRDTRLFRQLTILGRAHRIGRDPNHYLLTVPAYSQKGRFVSIEFSSDGKTWSAPQPYHVEHDYIAPPGARSVWVRLAFKDAKAVSAQKPVEIAL
jgi:hypothetical protein